MCFLFIWKLFGITVNFYLFQFTDSSTNNNNNNSNCRNPFSVSQEETITNFRRGAINLLVATQAAISTVTISGTELPRCNLVIALRLPNSLAEYLSSKARSRLVNYGAKVIYLMDHDSIEKINNNNNSNNVNNQSNLNNKQNRTKQKDNHSTVDSMCSNHINDQFLGK